MKKHASGLSLIELMVALAIGSLLIVGAVFVYSQSRRSHMVNDVAARLQENARYVLSTIEPDLQLAGYYGFTNAPDSFTFMVGGAATATSAADMQAGSPAVAGLGTTHICGNNFAIDLLSSVQGSNNTYLLGCLPPVGNSARNTTDTLTIRRSSVGTVAPTNARLQLFVSRLSTEQRLFVDGNIPAAPALAAGAVEVRDLIVRTYYIATNSDNQPGVPALRVKILVGGGPFFDDQEVMPGVEDLQVQFAIDTANFNGVATRYVNPDGVPLGAQVAAVRIWLVMRAEQAEPGFVDSRPYVYADRNIPPPNDGFRRVVVSRTIQLRNSRTL